MFRVILRSRANRILLPIGLAWAIIAAGWILPIIGIVAENLTFWLLVCVGWMIVEVYFTFLAYLDYEARKDRRHLQVIKTKDLT